MMSIFRRRFRVVSVSQARQLLEQGHVLLDVRSDKEWAAGHAAGAIHIPVGALESRVNELPDGVPVVTICHSGVRSAMAASTLAKHGVSVASIRGGMIAWNRARQRHEKDPTNSTTEGDPA